MSFLFYIRCGLATLFLINNWLFGINLITRWRCFWAQLVFVWCNIFLHLCRLSFLGCTLRFDNSLINSRCLNRFWVTFSLLTFGCHFLIRESLCWNSLLFLIFLCRFNCTLLLGKSLLSFFNFLSHFLLKRFQVNLFGLIWNLCIFISVLFLTLFLFLFRSHWFNLLVLELFLSFCLKIFKS